MGHGAEPVPSISIALPPLAAVKDAADILIIRNPVSMLAVAAVYCRCLFTEMSVADLFNPWGLEIKLWFWLYLGCRQCNAINLSIQIR